MRKIFSLGAIMILLLSGIATGVFARPGVNEVLGIIVMTPEKETLEHYGLNGGAEIIKVLKGSEAERAGLKEKDIIVRVNDQEVKDARDFAHLWRRANKDEDVRLTINRKGKELELKVRGEGEEEDVEEWHWPRALDSLPRLAMIGRQMAAMAMGKGGYLGVEVDNLNPQLKEYFEVKFGVLVKRVEKDTPAEKAGIKAGDVIFKVENKKIEDVADLVRTINYYDPGEEVTVTLMRKGREKKIKVKLGKKPGMRHSPFFFRKKWKEFVPEKFFREYFGNPKDRLDIYMF